MSHHSKQVAWLQALNETLLELVGVLIGANQTLTDPLLHFSDKEEFLWFCEVEGLSSDGV